MPDAHATASTLRLDASLRDALVESRQRWRDLVAMTADFAFETDAVGRFTFVMPDPVLGWPVANLLDEPSERMLVNGPAGFDPFRPEAPFRRQRVWLRRADGGQACLIFAAAPLRDSSGNRIGTRGLGIDVTEQDGETARTAAALRRAEVIDYILSRMRQEVMAPRMMRAALEALVTAIGAEGAAVVSATQGQPLVMHQCGSGVLAALDTIGDLLAEDNPALASRTAEGRPVLVSSCETRFGERAGLAVWRVATARDWDAEDRMLADAATSIVRVVLEHQVIQREMARQARTDPLTGLPNRRAFLEELPAHIARLEREELPGTLVFVDLDNFKSTNDLLGHEVGDRLLCRAAQLLRRTVRPTDLVARLGGDEFAIWLNGADHLTAAERAETLRVTAPEVFAEVIGAPRPRVSFSIGIATRRPGGGEEIESVMRRADLAMYAVKHDGRGHWRVAPEDSG